MHAASPAPEMTLHGLCAVTLDDLLLPRLSALVKAALDGGAPFVQYRNKIAPRPLRRAQAAEMLRICRAAGARLIINDDVWLAVEIGADGAHLGRDDAPGGSLAAARDALVFQHMGIYACRREALQRWVSLSPHPLELVEKLEQLRALDNGIAIAVVKVNYDSVGVDLPEDVERVERLLGTG